MKGGGFRSIGYTRELSGSRPTSENDKCDSINFLTKLQNIQPALSSQSKGDILNVDLDPNGSIVAIGQSGTCGTISSIESIMLIECLKKGKSYKATIINISTSSCEVRVRFAK